MLNGILIYIYILLFIEHSGDVSPEDCKLSDCFIANLMLLFVLSGEP
jgi:hypothetical protein